MFFFFPIIRQIDFLKKCICEGKNLPLSSRNWRQGNIAACKAFQFEGRRSLLGLATSQPLPPARYREPAGGAEQAKVALRDNGSRASG